MSEIKNEKKTEVKTESKTVVLVADQNINFAKRIRLYVDTPKHISVEEFEKLKKDLPNFKDFVEKGHIKLI